MGQSNLDSGMTFDSSPVQQDTPADSGMTFDNEPVKQDTPISNGTVPGEQINDVGNRVIVPKEGESFADTMKRAADYGKTVTPKQINAETATVPAKAAQVLTAAPVIGAGGAAALAVPGELYESAGALKNFVLKKLAEQSPELFGHEAVKETLKKYALQGLQKAAAGATWAGGTEILHSIWDDVFGKKK